MGSILRRWLGFSRTRLFVAVLVPCIIGASAAYRDGFFNWWQFAFLIFGLIMVESASLFLADWATYNSSNLPRGEAQPTIEGSPMLPVKLLPSRYTMQASLVCLALSVLSLLSFVAQRGLVIVLLGVAAIAIGAFYAFSPVKYGFFSTALLPVLISFGTYYAMSGTTLLGPALAGSPTLFISTGVIFTYRVLYMKGNEGRYDGLSKILVCTYLLAFIVLVGVVLSGFVTFGVGVGLLASPLLLLIIKTIKVKRDNYIEATSLGVILYTATGILISIGYAFL